MIIGCYILDGARSPFSIIALELFGVRPIRHAGFRPFVLLLPAPAITNCTTPIRSLLLHRTLVQDKFSKLVRVS